MIHFFCLFTQPSRRQERRWTVSVLMARTEVRAGNWQLGRPIVSATQILQATLSMLPLWFGSAICGSLVPFEGGWSHAKGYHGENIYSLSNGNNYLILLILCYFKFIFPIFTLSTRINFISQNKNEYEKNQVMMQESNFCWMNRQDSWGLFFFFLMRATWDYEKLITIQSHAPTRGPRDIICQYLFIFSEP